jgi:hypothetical protein
LPQHKQALLGPLACGAVPTEVCYAEHALLCADNSSAAPCRYADVVVHRQLLAAVAACGPLVQGADLQPPPDLALLLQQVRWSQGAALYVQWGVCWLACLSPV